MRPENQELNPAVSIGLPVRNGGSLIRSVIESLLNQSDRDFELIISDNVSSDQTENICRSFAEQDKRIRYFRQTTMLTAIDNFRFVYEQCAAPYFLWAAHDDRRSDNYVEVLRKSLDENPDAVLAFGDYFLFDSHDVMVPRPYEALPHRRVSSIRKNLATGVYSKHMYAMIRSSALSDYAWYGIEYGEDIPLLYYLAFKGDFVYAKGTSFFYFEAAKAAKDRAVSNSFRSLRSFPRTRLAWTVAKAVAAAKKSDGETISALQVLPFTLYRWWKRSIYESLPAVLRRTWDMRRSNAPEPKQELVRRNVQELES